MADLALGVVKDIVKTGMAIKEAVETVRQNQEECQDLQVFVATTIAILSRLQEMELTRHPAMCDALKGLNGSLNRALKLVTECQKRKAMHRFLTAGDTAKQLRRVKDIQRNMQLGNLAITASIMEVTFEYTRTTTVRYDGTQPQQAAAEVEIYSSNSTTGGVVRSVEYSGEIITMVAGAEASSAPSSRLTEFRLSETVARRHISKGNIDWGCDCNIRLKIVIKMRMASEMCLPKAMARLARAACVTSITIADGKDQLVVVGHNVYLMMLLRKVTPVVVLKAVPAKQVEYMTKVVNAEEAQQEPATRWPRSRISGGIQVITTKLSRFMRPRPRSSTTCQAAPLSSPLLMEHTDTPAPVPTTGPWPHLFPGESSSSMTFSAATPPAGIHQYQKHARTSARRAKAGDLIEKPDLLLLQHQPAAPPATAPVRHRRRTFNISKIHRSGRLPAVRQSRMMPRAKRIEASSFERSGARVLLPLMSCALCALVLLVLASVWALR